MSYTRDNSARQVCRLQIFGDRGVGKSCFFSQLARDQIFLTWPAIMPQQCQISHSHRVAGSESDTQQKFIFGDCIHSASTSVVHEVRKKLECSCYHGVFLLYSVDSRPSFDLIFTLYKEIGHAKREHQRRTRAMTPEIDSYKPIPNDKPPPPSQSSLVFPIFKLPTELQLTILRACLVAPTSIIDMDTDESGINLNILLTCRLFFHEGRRLFLKHNTFRSSTRICLVGTKSDVPDDKREVSAKEGEELANIIGGDYFEVSNRNSSDVKRVFEHMAEDVYDQMRKVRDETSTCSCAVGESENDSDGW